MLSYGKEASSTLLKASCYNYRKCQEQVLDKVGTQKLADEQMPPLCSVFPLTSANILDQVIANAEAPTTNATL